MTTARFGPRGVVGELPAEEWRRIAASPRRLLMLDYDGTLAPFDVDRMRARPSDETLRALRAICASPRDRLVVISGRPIGELESLLPDLSAHLVGEHGWEERAPEGGRTSHPLPSATAHCLTLAVRAASASGYAPHLERKRCSVVLHTRGLPDEVASRVEEACALLWSSRFEREGLVLDRINGGLELRAAARNKGVVVREWLRSSPPDTLSVYAGDDRADESAFLWVRHVGITIRVGQGADRTAAQWRFDSVDQVTAFLRHWPGTDAAGRP